MTFDKEEVIVNILGTREEFIKRLPHKSMEMDKATVELYDFLYKSFDVSLTQAYQAGREEGMEEAFNDIITLRSPFVYDDYSSLYQQSGKIWTEYAEKENELINKKLDHLKETK